MNDTLTVGQLLDQRDRARDIATTLEGELEATKPVVEAARAVNANPYPPGTRAIARAVRGLEGVRDQDLISAAEIAERAAAAARAIVRLHVALRNYNLAIDLEETS